MKQLGVNQILYFIKSCQASVNSVKISLMTIVFFLEEQVNFYTYFPYFMADFDETQCKGFPPNVIEEFCDLWKSVQWQSYQTKLCRIAYTFFVQCYTKFGTQHGHSLGSDCEFCENQCSENYTFLKGHNLYFATAFHIYCPIWVIFGTRDVCIMLLSISVFCACWPRKPSFFYGCNWMYTCAIKLYEILNIQHALVMSVFITMEYTSFSLVTVKMTVTSYTQKHVWTYR
jgi:hypothetical protein